MRRFGCASEDGSGLYTERPCGKRRASGEADVYDRHAGFAETGREVGRAWCDGRGDGIERSVLEAGMGNLRRAIRHDAGECGAHQERAWPEDVSEGRRMDRRVAAAWADQKELRAAGGRTGPEGTDALSCQG